MVDLQTHLVPGFDDGAADDAAALEICRAAARAGVREIVAAPSCDPRYGFDRAALEAKVQALQQTLGDEIFLHTGAVLRLTYEGFADAIRDLSRYSINSRKYVLLRPSGGAVGRGVAKLFSAIQDAGYVGIVSRPETSANMQGDLRRLRHWVRRGSLIAVGAGSILGYAGARAEECALALLDADIAHFIVSDAKSADRRTPTLLDAYRFAVYRVGAERARRLLVDHPWAALWGESIAIPRPQPLKPHRSLASALGLGRGA